MKKRLLSVMLSLCLAAGTAVFPYSAKEAFAEEQKTIDGLLYEEAQDGSITITGYSGKAQTLTIPGEINGKAVTQIDDESFLVCKTLKTVTLPDSLTKINYGAFAGCKNLKSISIPRNVSEIGSGAFSGCESLDTIILPSAVTKIESGVFADCKSLKNITVPVHITEISSEAFAGCESLETFPFPDDLTTIYGAAFKDCRNLKKVDLPEKLSSIDQLAFEGCTSLENIYIPEKVKNIGNEAFAHCTSLKSITVDMGNRSYGDNNGILFTYDRSTLLCCPGGMPQDKIAFTPETTIIACGAFEGCQNLESISLPGSIKTIESGAFSFCINLKSIEIPDSVQEINPSAFSNCIRLESFIVDEVNTKFSSSEDGALYNKEKNTLLFCPLGKKGKFQIPNTVTTIAETAFNGCSAGKGFNSLYDNIPNIGKGCAGLESIEIPESVTDIHNGAFNGCTNLGAIEVDENNQTFASADGVLYDKNKTKLLFCPEGKQGDLVIPDTITNIDYSSFGYTNNLKSISIPENAALDLKVFYNLTGLEALNIKDPKNFTCVDGVVYSKDSETLLFCPRGKKGSLTIPANVTGIGEDALSDCAKLTDITISDSFTAFSDLHGCDGLTSVTVPASHKTCASVDGIVYSKDADELVFYPNAKQGEFQIPDSVTTICQKAFYGCHGLTGINIPVGVTLIESFAFGSCHALTDVYYSGSPSLWDEVYLESGNSNLLDAAMHYAIEEPNPDPQPDPNPQPNPYPNPYPQPNPQPNPYPQPNPQPNPQPTPNPPEPAPILPPAPTPDIPVEPTPVTPPEQDPPVTPPDPYPEPDMPDKWDFVRKKGEGISHGYNFYCVTKTGAEVTVTQTFEKKATIPSSISMDGITYKVTGITANAFYGNKKLKKITIGKNVRMIQKNAFRSCKNLKSIVIKTKKLKKVGKNAFKGIHAKAKIKVPSQKAKKYKKLLKGKGQGKYVKITK